MAQTHQHGMLGQDSEWIAIRDASRLPKVLLTIPLAKSDWPAIGLVGTSIIADHRVWILNVEEAAETDSIARLLAILLVNDAENILPQPFMPVRAPTALLLRNREIRTTRGFSLAPWALAEIERVAEVLLTDHPSYLRDVGDALRQSAGVFQPLPDNVLFKRVNIPSLRHGPAPPEIPINIENSERVRLGLQRHDLVAADYSRNRYMLLLSETDLARRAEDVLANLHVLSPDGLVSLDQGDLLLGYWLDRLMELQVEMAYRHGRYPAGWDKRLIQLEHLPDSARVAGTPQAAFRLETTVPVGRDILVKYGLRAHMELALDEGLLRIAPASTYRDASLNRAVRDDELQAELFWDQTMSFNVGAPGTVLLPAGRRKIRLNAAADYYVYCMARRLSSRLMVDFAAEACLVIRDPDVFLKRLERAMPAEIRTWLNASRDLEYYDPLQVQPSEVTLGLSKHFRFAYQGEFRAVWQPRAPVDDLKPLMIRLGNLSDIAEVVLPKHAGN